MGRVSKSVLEAVALQATVDLHGADLKALHKQCVADAGVLADKMVDSLCPNRKEVMSIAGKYFDAVDKVEFKTIWGQDSRTWLTKWKGCWSDFNFFFGSLSLNKPWGMMQTSFKFPQHRSLYEIPKSWEARFQKVLTPFMDAVKKAQDFYAATLLALTSAGTVLRIKENLPSLVKYFPKGEAGVADPSGAYKSVEAAIKAGRKRAS